MLGCLAPQIALSQEPSDFFYGGEIGLAFGDVGYVEISPMVGMYLSEDLSAGVSATYRWRSDSRTNPKRNTEDYGATVFTRFHISETTHLQAEYEYMDYEIYNHLTMTSERRQLSSFLAGAGISQPIGQRSYTYATVLYNFSYDENDSLYSDPIVYRIGISVGF